MYMCLFVGGFVSVHCQISALDFVCSGVTTSWPRKNHLLMSCVLRCFNLCFNLLFLNIVDRIYTEDSQCEHVNRANQQVFFSHRPQPTWHLMKIGLIPEFLAVNKPCWLCDVLFQEKTSIQCMGWLWTVWRNMCLGLSTIILCLAGNGLLQLSLY